MTPQDIAALAPQERFDLLIDLWDSLSAEGVMLTPAQEAELAQRAAALDYAHDELEWSKPLLAEAIAEIERGEGVPLSEFEARLDGLLGALSPQG
ncbi:MULTISPECIES: addiction module protein [unclassified Bradyrhizobium]|uniref:addiction module protein n=1 Tax=unclassified Bradyrhizobium TaxID=2631580 RepID=UPI0028ED0BAE|nr:MULTISPECIES: addiction module protein [unclassified Bradyrhizobium]